jgi:hypothetical protein
VGNASAENSRKRTAMGFAAGGRTACAHLSLYDDKYLIINNIFYSALILCGSGSARAHALL